MLDVPLQNDFKTPLNQEMIKIAALPGINDELKTIIKKVEENIRISPDEGLYLFNHGSLALLGSVANSIREKRHGNTTYFNRNFHIEPTNICVFSCKFCSYSRLYSKRDEGWELSIDEMVEKVKTYDGNPITEVHIVGGVHPKMDIYFFEELLKKIKTHRPSLHIKGFTAVELDYMFRKAKLSRDEGLALLQKAGLDSLPGGGAEILDEEIRNQISGDKVDAEGWLDIHKKAHLLGMHSNATMLFGHVEKPEHRIMHMERLRKMQDETNGFNTFIPLKFRNHDNEMSHIPESSVIDDMKTYAMSRIYLDNFSHIKAYWPMLGREQAQLSLSFGVNDMDGTIDDSTKIYSMAGSEEQNPTLTTEELVSMIKQVGREAVERDTLYNVIKKY